MKVEYERVNRIKFSELKPGDTFIDYDTTEYSAEMKIDYSDISYEFSETGEDPSDSLGASVSLKTGDVFFYRDDFYVIPIKLKVVGE
jgi:hypothetical protein